MYLLTKISIIIPVFNTSKYLPDCLDSILNQKFDDFEIICINDGSTDDSKEILNQYAQKDPRIKIINQKNQGLAASRNHGIDHAKGDYILFIDSDDYIEKDSLEEIYDIAFNNNLDLLLFKMINFDSKTKKLSQYSYFEMNKLKKRVKNKIFSYEDIKKILFRISVTAPGKLYKRELISDLRFNEGIIFEDNPFFIEMMINVKRAYYYEKYLYFRRIHDESITNSNYERFSDVITSYQFITNVLKENNQYEDLKVKLFNRQCRDIYLRYSQVPDSYKSDFYQKIKSEFFKINSKLDADVLNRANQRSKTIFLNALEFDDYHDFERSIQHYDFKTKLAKHPKSLKKKVKKLFNY